MGQTTSCSRNFTIGWEVYTEGWKSQSGGLFFRHAAYRGKNRPTNDRNRNCIQRTPWGYLYRRWEGSPRRARGKFYEEAKKKERISLGEPSNMLPPPTTFLPRLQARVTLECQKMAGGSHYLMNTILRSGPHHHITSLKTMNWADLLAAERL